MDIYEKVMALCKLHNTNKTAVEEACGFSQNSINKWKGSVPSIEKIIKIANYFNVSVDYLLGRADNQKFPALENINQSDNKPLVTVPHFVAHLDFLKTKKNIKKDGKSLLQQLREFVDLWSEYIDNYANKQNGTQLQDELKFRIFSDNIVMYIPYNRDNYFDALMLICHCCGYFQYLAFRYYGMMLRGGLCSGGFYADNSFIYGQALVDSYMIEEKVAIYPRIVVTDLIVEQINIQEKENLFMGFDNFIVQDPTTQTYYINFLWEHNKSDVQICRQILKDKIKSEQTEIKEKIKSGKRNNSDYFAEEHRISQKNNWLLYYIGEYDRHLFNKSYNLQPQLTPPTFYTQPAVASFVEQFHGLMEDPHFIDTAKIYAHLEMAVRSALYGELVKWLENRGVDVAGILGL